MEQIGQQARMKSGLHEILWIPDFILVLLNVQEEKKGKHQ